MFLLPRDCQQRYPQKHRKAGQPVDSPRVWVLHFIKDEDAPQPGHEHGGLQDRVRERVAQVPDGHDAGAQAQGPAESGGEACGTNRAERNRVRVDLWGENLFSDSRFASVVGL